METKQDYMEQFENAEEYIRHEVLTNRGAQNVMDKSELLEIVKQKCPKADEAALAKCSKAELLDRLVAQLGEKAYAMFAVGVGSKGFQDKFGISHKDVLLMAKRGFLQVAASTRFRMYGRVCTANTYSPYQYFQLTRDEVHKWLSEHQGRKKK